MFYITLVFFIVLIFAKLHGTQWGRADLRKGVPIFSAQREGWNTFLTLRLSCEGQYESCVLVQFVLFCFFLKEKQ